MPTFINLPAIEAPRNALLDFSGINNAIDDYRKRAEAEARKQSVRDIGQAWQNKDYDTATTLGFRSGDPELATRVQSMAQQQQQFDEARQKDAIAKMAAISQFIDNEKDPAKQKMMHDRWISSHEGYNRVLAKLPEHVRSDPIFVRQYFQAIARGYQDKDKLANLQADTAEKLASANYKNSQSEQSKYVANDPTKPLLNTRTGQYAPMPPNMTSENPYEATARKKQAEMAPAEFKASMEASNNANNMLNTASSMKLLIQEANVGKFSELRTDTQQVLRQFGFGQKDWDDRIARTQLLKGLLAPLVGQLGKEFKPLSNSDVAFITKAAGDPTLSPDTLKHIAGALEAEAKRQIIYHGLISKQLEKGQFPNYATASELARQRVPSYYDSMFGQKRDQPRLSETMQPQAPQTPAVAPTQAQNVPTMSPEQAAKAPSGTLFRGTDGKLYRVP